MDVERTVLEAVKGLLAAPLETMPWHDFDLEPGDMHDRGELLVLCRQRTDSDVRTKVLRAVFLHDEKQVHITNIFMPEAMTRNRLGKRVIKAMYEACAEHEYHLLIVDMVDSFYQRMLARGALRIDGDSVQIMRTTNLVDDVV